MSPRTLVRIRRLADTLVIALFIVAICLPVADNLLGLDRTAARAEKRRLADFPRVSLQWRELEDFPKTFQTYFEDNFGFRSRLIRWHGLLKMRLLHMSPSDIVLYGKDGWLFFADDGSLEDFESAQPFTGEQLVRWQQTLEHTRDWLARRGVRYLFVIAPDKHVIYPEYMPEGIRRIGRESRIDQLVTHMRAHSTVELLDLRGPLEEAKAHERLYHRTDTHWNDRGAFVGYQQIMGRVADSFPAARPLPRSAFDPATVEAPAMDLAAMVGLNDALTEEDLRLVPRRTREARVIDPKRPDPEWAEPLVVTEVASPALPRAVMFRDSFTSGLIPFLSEHFRRIVYLWQNEFDPDVIDHERPDFVIQELAGRRLFTYEPYDAVALERSAEP